MVRLLAKTDAQANPDTIRTIITSHVPAAWSVLRNGETFHALSADRKSQVEVFGIEEARMPGITVSGRGEGETIAVEIIEHFKKEGYSGK